MRVAAFVFVLLFSTAAHAQFDLQDAHTTADLRGIDSLGNGVAWASGTNGTVLRTEDSGFVWQLCAVPPGAEKLDFRGIQAFDNETAIVMSSGPGDLSRLYKTTDGCQTWKLIFTNPDKEGFFDDVFYDSNFAQTFVLGDPVNGRFRLFVMHDEQGSFAPYGLEPPANAGEAAFAASNSVLLNAGEFGSFGFVTGGMKSELIYETHGLDLKRGPVAGFSRARLPFQEAESSGAFSAATNKPGSASSVMVAVGGDYLKPQLAKGSAAFSTDWGAHWKLSIAPPHGYRSSVAYDPAHKTWITVGPNGTDISTDDGRNWRPLLPQAGEAPGADQHWNALSLPFVVGPHGRIGKLRPDAFQ
jgi:hypothetical protein